MKIVNTSGLALGCIAIFALLGTAVFGAPPSESWKRVVPIDVIEQDWIYPIEAIIEARGLRVISTQSNPVLKYETKFPEGILLQAQLFGVPDNDILRVIINDDFTLSFERQHGRITIKGTNHQGERDEILKEVQYLNGRIPCENPNDFSLSIALRSSGIFVWIDEREIMNAKPSELVAPYQISFSSGWESDWTLSNFSIFQPR